MEYNRGLLKQDMLDDIRKGKLMIPKKGYGRFENIHDYSDKEISEMYHGAYVHDGVIIINPSYELKLSDVISTICILSDVDYHKKSSLLKSLSNKRNNIKNIKTFYIKAYYLETGNIIQNTKRHDITNLLYNLGTLKLGRNSINHHYAVDNEYKILQNFKEGRFPKDLFYPIKSRINRLFFDNDYYFEFKVEGKIKIVED